MSLTIEQLAHLVDEELDKQYNYGRSSPGNNFGWLANMESVRAAKSVIDSGINDVEKIAAAVHTGWNRTARADYEGTLTLDTPTSPERKMKRYTLSQIPYEHLPESEKEKDRVVAITVYRALKG